MAITLLVVSRLRLVEGDPEAHDSAGIQMIAAHLVVFHRVQRGAALDPRVDRVGGDDVELLLGGAEEMPAVVVDHLDLLAIDHVGFSRAMPSTTW